MIVETWKLVVSAIIGVCITAGIWVAIEELLWMRRRCRLGRTRLREMWLSLSPLPINIVVTVAMLGVWATVYEQAHRVALGQIPVNGLGIVAALLAVDLSYYWEHRCAHRLPLLWNLYHAIHHSSADYTVATAYRVSFINQLFSPAFYVPWILLGMHPVLIAGLQLATFHYQAWLHTEMIGRLGILDHWFNTPAAHRVHHSAAPEHRDRNMGAVTLVWDRLFGTYAAPSPYVTYGITDVSPPRTLAAMYIDPWRRLFEAHRTKDD